MGRCPHGLWLCGCSEPMHVKAIIAPTGACAESHVTQRSALTPVFITTHMPTCIRNPICFWRFAPSIQHLILNTLTHSARPATHPAPTSPLPRCGGLVPSPAGSNADAGRRTCAKVPHSWTRFAAKPSAGIRAGTRPMQDAGHVCIGREATTGAQLCREPSRSRTVVRSAWASTRVGPCTCLPVFVEVVPSHTEAVDHQYRRAALTDLHSTMQGNVQCVGTRAVGAGMRGAGVHVQHQRKCQARECEDRRQGWHMMQSDPVSHSHGGPHLHQDP